MARGDTLRELDEQMATLVRRAVDDLRAQVRRRLEEATHELQERLGEVAPELPQSFISEEHVRRLAEEISRPSPEAVAEARGEGEAAGRSAGRSEAHHELRAALADIDRARSQSDVLEALLEAVLDHAGRAAVLLLRDGRLAGWGARGFEAEESAVRGVSLGADQEPWTEIAAGGPARVLPSGAAAGLVSQLDSPLPKEACVVPMVLRDRVAALVYADRTAAGGTLDVDAVQILVYTAALALETLSFRERDLTSTLRPADRPEGDDDAEGDGDEGSLEEPRGGEGSAAGTAEGESAGWSPAPPVAEAPEPLAPVDLDAPEEDGPVRAPDELSPDFEEAEDDPPALSDASEYELELDDVESADDSPWTSVETVPSESAVEVEELPPEEALPFQDDPGEIPIREYDYPRDEEEEGFEEAPDEEVEPAAAAAPETVAWSPRPVADEPEESDAADETVDTSAAADRVAEGGEAGEREEEAPPPTPPPSSGPVEPPEDVQGPGWAFSTPREPIPEDDEAAHEEARRLARLLVSEIQLYNQDEVDEGRRHRDIYERLRDDIDRSRQLYEERVEAGVRENTDYFYQELVRQLAAGDAKALGI